MEREVGPVRHVVVADLSESCTEAEQDALVRDLRSLQDLIPGVLSMTAGAARNTPSGRLRIGVVSDHATWDELEVYKAHPAHLEVAARLRVVTSSVTSADFAVDPAAS